MLLMARRSLALHSERGKKIVARRSVVSDGLKVALGALAGVLVVLLLVGGFSGGGMDYGVMGGMGHMMGGGLLGMLFAGLFWVLLLVVAVVVWIFDRAQRR